MSLLCQVWNILTWGSSQKLKKKNFCFIFKFCCWVLCVYHSTAEIVPDPHGTSTQTFDYSSSPLEAKTPKNCPGDWDLLRFYCEKKVWKCCTKNWSLKQPQQSFSSKLKTKVAKIFIYYTKASFNVKTNQKRPRNTINDQIKCQKL